MISYITGANGFIGSRLKVSLGDDVLPVPHDNICRAEFGTCDRFYFLSAYGNMAYQSDTQNILQANIVDLTHALRRSLPKLFAYFSSSSVALPVKTPYALTKLAGEKIVEASGLDYIIFRPYTVVGVGEQREHLIPTLIRSCLNGEHMNLTLNPTHDFIDVQDVVDGVNAICQSDMRGVVELGTGIPRSNEEILSIVEGITGKKANVTIVQSMRKYDHLDWYCRDTYKTKGYWKPKVTVEETIKNMVKAHERA